MYGRGGGPRKAVDAMVRFREKESLNGDCRVTITRHTRGTHSKSRSEQSGRELSRRCHIMGKKHDDDGAATFEVRRQRPRGALPVRTYNVK